MTIQQSRVNGKVFFIMLAMMMLSALVISPSLAQDSPDELPQQPILPLSMAMQAAQVALEPCADNGYQVSVAIVERNGMDKVLLRNDGAGPHTINSSRQKAFTSASMGRPTGDIANAIAGNPAIEGLRDMDDRLLFLEGRLPIVANGQVIAGIGVGGTPGGNLDAECAQAGIDSLGFGDSE